MTDERLKGYITSAINIKLENIPQDSKIGHSFSVRFEKKIKKLIKAQKRNPTYILFIKYAKNVAVVLIALFTITIAGIMSVSAYRERIFRFLIKDHVIYSEINVEVDTIEHQGEFVAVYPSYIPEGYKFFEDSNWEESIRRYYKNDQGGQYDYHQARINPGTFIWNTENVEIEKTMVGTKEITHWSNLGHVFLIWTGDDCFFEIYGNIPKEEAFKIAESLINKK